MANLAWRFLSCLLVLTALLTPIIVSSNAQVVNNPQGQVVAGWQVVGGEGNCSELTGLIMLGSSDAAPGVALYRNISPKSDFEISMQVEAATLGEIDRDPSGAGEGFAIMLRPNASMFAGLVGVNFELRARGGGQFLINRYDEQCVLSGWSDDWTPFVYDFLEYNDGYSFWHPGESQNQTGILPFPPFQSVPLYNSTDAPVRPDVWYTMKLDVQESPFTITAKVLDENGSLLGTYSVSDMVNFAFNDIGCVGISNGWGGTFYVANVTGVPPISTFDYSPSQPTAYSATVFNASNSYPQSQIVEYSWNFGDGKSASTMQPVTSHVYQTSGQFNVTLTVTDSSGINASFSRTLQVLLPDYLTISTDSAQSTVGSTVNVIGQLVDHDGNGLSNEPVAVFYTFEGADSWYPLSSAFTNQTGQYNIQWMNTASGTFTLKAQWPGNETCAGATATAALAVVPCQNQGILFVESNSTVSALSFNSATSELSFNASGPSGTMGYAKITVSKSLIQNAGEIQASIDGNPVNYSLSATADSWVLVFSYHHSAHVLNIFLPMASNSLHQFAPSANAETTPKLSQPLGPDFQLLAIIAVAVAAAILCLIILRKQRVLA